MIENRRYQGQKRGPERIQQRYATRDIAVEFPIGAAVVDISESGMGIESNQQLRIGANYVFRVQMGAKSFGLPGKVEWCRFARTKGVDALERLPVYKAGVSFAGGPARDSWCEALRRLVEGGIQPVSVASAS